MMPAGWLTGNPTLLRTSCIANLALALSITLSLSACSGIGFPGVYKIFVEQGNIVTAEMVEELKPDMTRRQVQFVLGTPIIEDTFNSNRWDYIYLLRIGNDITKESRLKVIFDGDRLVDVKGELVGDNWPEPKPEEDESQDASA